MLAAFCVQPLTNDVTYRARTAKNMACSFHAWLGPRLMLQLKLDSQEATGPGIVSMCPRQSHHVSSILLDVPQDLQSSVSPASLSCAARAQMLTRLRFSTSSLT